MHRIEWTNKIGSASKSFAVVTDGTMDDALALFVNARGIVTVGGRDEEMRRLLSQTAAALGRLAEHLVPADGKAS